MTYQLTNDKIEWMLNSPACRTQYFAGDSACAMGKLAYACLGEKAKTLGASLGDDACYPWTAAFVTDFNTAYINKTGTAPRVILMNDGPGNFHNNHLKAVRLAVQCGLESDFLTLETDKYAQEFSQQIVATV